MYRISNHLLHFYQDSVLAACKTQRIHVSKPLSATQLSSMMNASGVSGKSKQEIKKHLKAYLGPGFCPSQRLSEGHGVVKYGCINFTYEATYHITNHLRRFYRDSVLAACETQRLPVSKPMSATKFSSMMNASGVSGKGENEIKKHLKAHLGPGFCPSRRCI